ncbi:8334_t:CDS:2, partial [Entrophospora sp. SA101]
QLDDEIRLLSNPPCKLYSQITVFISPDLNNINHLGIPKPQNAFILYRKNYAAKHKSSGSNKDWKVLSKEASISWKNAPDEVKSYFKRLAKLAREKHKLIYGKKDSTTGNQLPKEYTFIDQQPELLQKIEVDNNNNNCKFSTPPYPHLPGQISGKEDLWNKIQQVWFEIGVETCTNLIHSMPERIHDVIKARGGYTRW